MNLTLFPFLLGNDAYLFKMYTEYNRKTGEKEAEMTDITPEARAFLMELYNRTQGDIEAQVHMHEIGLSIGVDEDDVGPLAESLYIQGLAELKTLSGDLGITAMGLESLDIKIETKQTDTDAFAVGPDPVLSQEQIVLAASLLDEIQAQVKNIGLDYEKLEELVTDIKTGRVQLTGSKPKTRILIEVFKSIHQNIGLKLPPEIKQKLEVIAAS